ncbi:hypothetical protein BJV41_002770 [Clostridium beijerinckii]|nr:hypothetical protein [Clostridium beijerinckii]OOM48930.1 hypothetical protein CBEIJ_18340 [Clostridium beijerinckii]
MNPKNSDKFLSILIYFLIVLLTCLLLYNLFLLVDKLYHAYDYPKNSIKVGPILMKLNN